MKVVCSQSELNSALQLVSRAVATRPTHPVLANVLLTADAGSNRLSLTGFDLSLGIQTSLAASVETSGPSHCRPGCWERSCRACPAILRSPSP